MIFAPFKKPGFFFARFLPSVNIRKFAISGEWGRYKSKRIGGFHIRLLEECDEKGFVEKCLTEEGGEDGPFESIPSSRHASVKSFVHGDRKFVKKIFYHRGLSDIVKDFFRTPRAFRSLAGDLLIAKSGLNAPRCLMVGKKGRVSFAVHEFLDGGENLDSLAKNRLKRPLSRQQTLLKRRIAREAGRVAGRLHANGICHGDMRLGNILAKQDRKGRVQLWLLDNERTFLYAILPEKKRVKNLVQLNIVGVDTVTNTDRMRFFLEYLEKVPEIAARKKSLAEGVLRKTSVRLEKILNKQNGNNPACGISRSGAE